MVDNLTRFWLWLQCSDSDLRGGSRDVLYEPGGKVDLISAVFSRYLSGMPNTIKIVLSAKNVSCFGINSFKSLS